MMGQVAALARSHRNGLIPFERTITQITETMPASPKPTAATLDDKLNYKLTRAATHLMMMATTAENYDVKSKSAGSKSSRLGQVHSTLEISIF